MTTTLKVKLVIVILAIVIFLTGLFGAAFQAQRALPLHHSSSVHSTLVQAYIPHPWCPAPPYVC